MKYRLAIFDLDGTILDTLEDLTDSTNYALSQYGFPERDLCEVRNFVGNGILKLIERAAPQNTAKETIQELLKCFRSYYKLHCADKTKPYDGVKELIEKLRSEGCLTAVVSNKADFAVQELCGKYFPELFDFVVGEKEGIRRKPYPDSVLKVLERFNISKEKTVYIGDSDIDIKLAQNAGIDSILVDWGFRDRDYLHENGAKIIVSTADEILSFF